MTLIFGWACGIVGALTLMIGVLRLTGVIRERVLHTPRTIGSFLMAALLIYIFISHVFLDKL